MTTCYLCGRLIYTAHWIIDTGGIRHASCSRPVDAVRLGNSSRPANAHRCAA